MAVGNIVAFHSGDSGLIQDILIYAVFLIYVSNIIHILGAKGDWDFWISDLVKKTLMELIFNPYGEYRCPEVPVSQIHFSHLHIGTPGSFQMF